MALGVPILKHFRVDSRLHKFFFFTRNNYECQENLTVITSLISMFRGPGLLAVAAKELSINSAKAYATK